MPAVRRLSFLLLLAAALAGCGSSSSPTPAGSSSPTTTGTSSASPNPDTARSTTTAKGSARFTVLIDAVVGGSQVRSSETGTISFSKRLAHLYKLLPGGGMPQELIVDGPFVYSNANIEAALKDRSVKPWTKLDTRRLSAKERRSKPDELAHVVALVYLPDGMKAARRIDSMTVANERVTQFRGQVDPARVIANAPASLRSGLAQALRNDYPAQPFPASFWLDDAGRVRRVLVSYTTSGGTQISLDGRFSEFGIAVDTAPPPSGSTADVSP
jgi:hypothetical protein